MDDLFGTINRAIDSKQNNPSSFGYAALLMVVQLMKAMKDEGKLNDNQLETIIHAAAKIGFENPRVPAENLMGVFYLTCAVLDLPTDEFELDDEDESE